MLLLIIVLLLLFGGGGGYYGYSRWGRGGGFRNSRDSHSYCRGLVFPRRLTLRGLAHCKIANAVSSQVSQRSSHLIQAWLENSQSPSASYFLFIA